jgi:hypothetical protein
MRKGALKTIGRQAGKTIEDALGRGYGVRIELFPVKCPACQVSHTLHEGRKEAKPIRDRKEAIATYAQLVGQGRRLKSIN